MKDSFPDFSNLPFHNKLKFNFRSNMKLGKNKPRSTMRVGLNVIEHLSLTVTDLNECY